MVGASRCSARVRRGADGQYEDSDWSLPLLSKTSLGGEGVEFSRTGLTVGMATVEGKIVSSGGLVDWWTVGCCETLRPAAQAITSKIHSKPWHCAEKKSSGSRGREKQVGQLSDDPATGHSLLCPLLCTPLTSRLAAPERGFSLLWPLQVLLRALTPIQFLPEYSFGIASMGSSNCSKPRSLRVPQPTSELRCPPCADRGQKPSMPPAMTRRYSVQTLTPTQNSSQLGVRGASTRGV